MSDLDQLDETNRLLLRELHADPRITMSALARKVGMSAPAVTERVQRMQRAGVITGFSMGVDPAAARAAGDGVRPGPARGAPARPRSPRWPSRSSRSASATASPARTASSSRCTPRPSPSSRRRSTSSSCSARPSRRSWSPPRCRRGRCRSRTEACRRSFGGGRFRGGPGPVARSCRHSRVRRGPRQGVLRRPRLATGRRLPLRQRLPRRPAHASGVAVLGAVRQRHHDRRARHRRGALPDRVRHRGGPEGLLARGADVSEVFHPDSPGAQFRADEGGRAPGPTATPATAPSRRSATRTATAG